MERLLFVCPETDRQVDVGIETEIDTLLRIKGETVRATCPACGKVHEWQVRDAALSKAAQHTAQNRDRTAPGAQRRAPR